MSPKVPPPSPQGEEAKKNFKKYFIKTLNLFIFCLIYFFSRVGSNAPDPPPPPWLGTCSLKSFSFRFTCYIFQVEHIKAWQSLPKTSLKSSSPTWLKPLGRIISLYLNLCFSIVFHYYVSYDIFFLFFSRNYIWYIFLFWNFIGSASK